MNIAFFVDTYFPQLNGVTISVRNFTDQLRKNGHTVTIFAPNIPYSKDRKEENIFRLSSFKAINSEPEIWFPLPVPNRNFREMFRQRFDVIHAHGNGVVSLFGLGVAKARKIPYILTFHTIHTHYTHYIFGGKLITPKVVSFVLKMYANQCDGVITPSEKMKQELISYGYRKGVTVVPNFIDFALYENIHSNYLHNLLRLPSKAPLLVTAGRLGAEKNFEFLLRVFRRVCKKDKTSHLVIVGKGPEKDSLEKLAKSLGVEDRTHFTGVIDASIMPQVYKDATVFIFSSTTETQGICMLEAAAAGVPIVAVDDEAFVGTVEQGKNGFLVSLDEEIFCTQVLKLIEDMDLNRQLGHESLRVARENFSPEHITAALISFYEKMIKEYRN